MVASPAESFQKLKRKIKPEWKTAFLGALVIGLLIHMPVMLSDIPNHDGLDSMYFDQNMITSGRWFLTIACGFSSYYYAAMGDWPAGAFVFGGGNDCADGASGIKGHGSHFAGQRSSGIFSGAFINFCICVYAGWLYAGAASGGVICSAYQKVSFRFCMGRGLSCIQYGNISGISFCRHAPVYLLHSGNLHGTKQLEA